MLFVGILLWGTSARSGATPLPQNETPTPAPISLTIDSFTTQPSTITIGEEFSILIQLRNNTSTALENVEVDVRDIEADWALWPVGGFGTMAGGTLAPGTSTVLSQRFFYRAGILIGLRTLEIKMSYRYFDGQGLTQAVDTRLFTLRVAEPTATPTPTPTLTPTSTP
ncbi:MAG: hypothetical protein KDE31_25430, partial [Caldilineaceae bacterium]|nr:hypothetical protein [Caldilineaceae bacterium]